MRVEARIAATAARQHGLVAREQAIAAGCTPDAIRSRVRTGRWRRAQRGVYAIAGAPPTWHQAVLAACLAAGPPVAASHRTAGILWGLPVPPADGVHLLTPSTRRTALPGVVQHRSAHVPVADLVVRSAVPVTTVARTLVDLSDDPGVRLGAAIDDARRRHLLRLGDLVACLARFDARPGRRLDAIRLAVARRLPEAPADSDGELWVLRTLLAAGLPAPVQQHRVVLEGRRRRIDLAYPGAMVAIEFDGVDTHRDLERFHDDRARSSTLDAAGWTVLPFTHETPEAAIVSRTSAALELAARRAPA